MQTYQESDNVYKCTHVFKMGRAAESSGRMRQLLWQQTAVFYLYSLYCPQKGQTCQYVSQMTNNAI